MATNFTDDLRSMRLWEHKVYPIDGTCASKRSVACQRGLEWNKTFKSRTDRDTRTITFIRVK